MSRWSDVFRRAMQDRSRLVSSGVTGVNGEESPPGEEHQPADGAQQESTVVASVIRKRVEALNLGLKERPSSNLDAAAAASGPADPPLFFQTCDTSDTNRHQQDPPILVSSGVTGVTGEKKVKTAVSQ